MKWVNDCIKINYNDIIMQTTKEELVSKIKEWVKIESEMKMLQKELKERRSRKKALSDDLVHVMKSNEIDCFDLKEGKILYTQNRIKAPLSKKHLMTCLQEYFEKHPNVEGDDVANYVLEKRETKLKEGIRHKEDKYKPPK